jgi:E3 ubiquitin-protein ligase RFWD2
VNRLVAKATALAHRPVSPVVHLQQSLSQDTLGVADINALLSTLLDRKRRIEAEEHEVELEILAAFLQRLRQEKQEVHAERGWARPASGAVTDVGGRATA